MRYRYSSPISCTGIQVWGTAMSVGEAWVAVSGSVLFIYLY
jgi:hypothetical protein